MKNFLITYDLGLPESRPDYANLIAKIKENYPGWAHPAKSVWIIKTDQKPSEVRDLLKPHLDSNDKLLVIELAGTWATYNIVKEVTEWMRREL